MELLGAVEAALEAVAPEEAIARAAVREGASLRVGGDRVELEPHERVVVLGFGKAAIPMGLAVLRLSSAPGPLTPSRGE